MTKHCMIILSWSSPSVSQGSFFQEHISFPVSSIEWSWWVPLGVVKVDCHWQKLFNDRSAWWEMVKPGWNRERREINVMIYLNLYLWLIYTYFQDHKINNWHCLSLNSLGFKWEPQRQYKAWLSRKSYVHVKTKPTIIHISFVLHFQSTYGMCFSLQHTHSVNVVSNGKWNSKRKHISCKHTKYTKMSNPF